MVKIGWAKRETSLNEPLSLFGQSYLRISEGIHDPTYATALAVEGDEGIVIFCSCDLEAWRDDIIPNTIAKVTACRPEIPADSIIMNCTHAHSCGSIIETPEKAPDGAPVYSGLKYKAFLENQCADAIVQAWDNRKEGGISYGYGYAVVAHSRRVVYDRDICGQIGGNIDYNGHALMYGPTNKAEFSHYEAGADHFLNVMFTFDPQQKLTGIVVNVPCPSQLSELFTQQSADFWHEVRQMVQESYGQDVYVLPQCAAAGDLSPRILHYQAAQQRRMKLKYGLEYNKTSLMGYNKVIAERRDIAQRILAGIEDVYSWAKKDIQTKLPVSCRREKLLLPSRLITREERDWCESNSQTLRQSIPVPTESTVEEYRKAVTLYDSISWRNDHTIERYENQNEDDTQEVCIHVARIGDVAFATNPFELYMDYMHRIQARSPFVQTFVVQLCSDVGHSYLSTERANANKGYSANMFSNSVSWQGGQALVERTLTLLEELKS